MTLVTWISLLSILPVYSAQNCNITRCARCKTISECDVCMDRYYLESGYCIPCPTHCLTCTGASFCQTCVTSYWNPGDQCNFPCTNCSSSGCEDTQGRCYECIAGRYGTLCNKDCSLCTYDECDRFQCTNGCIAGYLQYNAESGYSDCFSCTTNCIKCSNTTFCTQCEQGFYGHYYRIETGRGKRQCFQCQEECTQCASLDQCPECNNECVKQGCDVSGICVTTPSTLHTKSKSSTRQLDSTKHFQTTSKYTACPVECLKGCDVQGNCLDTTTIYSKSGGLTTENNNHEALNFSHGIAAGVGITVAVGALIGIVVYLFRRTNCFHTMNRTKSSTDSRQQHVYVNTQEQPISSDKPEYEDVEANSDIRVTMSGQEIDADREYISLGERQTEHNYSDLQANRQ